MGFAPVGKNKQREMETAFIKGRVSKKTNNTEHGACAQTLSLTQQMGLHYPYWGVASADQGGGQKFNDGHPSSLDPHLNPHLHPDYPFVHRERERRKHAASPPLSLMRAHNSTGDFFSRLPDEIWFDIFSLLDVTSLIENGFLVNRTWYRALRDCHLWHSVYFTPTLARKVTVSRVMFDMFGYV